jgi:hypothetical protein
MGLRISRWRHCLAPRWYLFALERLSLEAGNRSYVRLGTNISSAFPLGSSADRSAMTIGSQDFEVTFLPWCPVSKGQR